MNANRLSQEDHSFFDYNRHTSLPALPFEAKWPAFVNADLTIEDESITLFDPTGVPPPPMAGQHMRRPSSPRPSEHLPPHVRRFSGQWGARAPPPAPSALAHAQLVNVDSPAPKSALSRLSFGLFGGWSGSQQGSVSASSHDSLPMSGNPARFSGAPSVGSDRPDPLLAMRSSHPLPPPPPRKKIQPRYIKATEVKRPRASRVGRLDFAPSCCADTPIFVV